MLPRMRRFVQISLGVFVAGGVAAGCSTGSAAPTTAQRKAAAFNLLRQVTDDLNSVSRAQGEYNFALTNGQPTVLDPVAEKNIRRYIGLLDGMRQGSDYPTPPLARGTSGPLRIRELGTGLGAR